MIKLDLVLLGSHGGELDRVSMNVADEQDCSREVMATLSRERWVLSVGDRIEVINPRVPRT